MVLRKKTKRLPGKGPPLGHIANQPTSLEIHKEVQPDGEETIVPETEMGKIRRGRVTKSKKPSLEELRTPTPRGKLHLGFNKRGTQNLKHGGGSLPGVVIQDDVNRDNVDNVIQQVHQDIVEEMGTEEYNQDEQGGNEDGDEQGDDNDDHEEDGDKDGNNEDDESEEDSDEEEEEELEMVKNPKKTPKKPCARYAYIPDDTFCLPPKNPTYGTPKDGGEVLIGYKNSWAAKIFATKDHNNAVRILKRQKNKKWNIENECDEVRLAVFDCVLWKAIEHAHQKFDAFTVSAFVERVYPETDTFHLPFGEMAITPDDCNRITGLPITGTSVLIEYDPSMSYELLGKLVERCLGWSDSKAQCEFRRAAKEPDEGDEYNELKPDL